MTEETKAAPKKRRRKIARKPAVKKAKRAVVRAIKPKRRGRPPGSKVKRKVVRKPRLGLSLAALQEQSAQHHAEIGRLFDAVFGKGAR